MNHKVRFSPEAQGDLLDLYDYIADQAGDERALAYIERIERFCMQLGMFPQRGTMRSDLRPGLRVIGFERRASIGFHVEPGSVTVLRILYAGRDLPHAFDVVE